MLNNAISKIQTEIDKNANNTYIQAVGGFLLRYLVENPESAEKILVPDKTIGKSLDEMRKEASKKKVGSCAVLTDQEGFAVVLKYFGIKATAPTSAPKVPIPQIQAAIAGSKPVIDFNIKLEDLL